MDGEGPVPIQVVDVRQLLELLRQMANKVTMEVEYTNGEPRLTLIIPHESAKETLAIMSGFEKMTESLVSQAYEKMGVWKKPEEAKEGETRQKKSPRDPSVA